MSARPVRIAGASVVLLLWMSTLVAPWMLNCAEDMAFVTEIEHSEQETEGEELSLEWEETTLSRSVASTLISENWHVAHLVNVRLHERLDASRLLDPPDQRPV